MITRRNLVIAGIAAPFVLTSEAEALSGQRVAILSGKKVVSAPPVPTFRSTILSTPNLLGFWPLGDATGSTAFADASAAGNNLTIHGGVTLAQAGINANDPTKSASFDGSTGYALAASSSVLSFDYTQPFSIEAEINVTSKGSASQEQFIWSKELNSGNFTGISFGVVNNAGTLVMEVVIVNAIAHQIRAYGTQSISTGVNHRVKISYQGNGTVNGINLWLDGVIDPGGFANVIDDLAAQSIVNTASVCIGARNGGGGFFGGTIQYVALYGTSDPNGTFSTHSLYSEFQPYDLMEPALYNLGIQGRVPISDPVKPNVIHDTDMSEDLDDVFDLYILCKQHLAGKINLIGVIACSSNIYSAPCCQSILNFFGIPATVYAYQGSSLATTSLYTQSVTGRFLPGQTRANYGDATQGYRSMLSRYNNVIIVSTGFCNVLAALLASAANAGGDGLPSGVNLVTNSVYALVFASGFSPTCSYGAASDFNFNQDPVSANAIVSGSPSWPTPIVQGGDEMAEGTTGESGSTGVIDIIPNTGLDPTINPMIYAYNLYKAGSGALDPGFARIFYSVGAVCWATEGLSTGRMTWGGIGGTETINSSTGANSWTNTAPSGAPPWSFLRKKASDAALTTWGNGFLQN